MKSFIRKSIIFIAVFILTSTIHKSQAQVNIQDSLALVDLYNSTNGPGWTNNTNWLTGPVKSWYGVSDFYGDRVGRIVLSNNRLIGTIPTSICNMAKLDFLSLDGNQLNGTIPSEIGNLKDLRLLSMYGNQLEGVIPESIGNLKKLYYFNFGNNQLSGSIPETIGDLPELKYLHLLINQLSGSIPETIGNARKLEKITFENNRLSGEVPSSIGNLNNLEVLWLRDNLLSGTFPDVSGLTSLNSLVISNNSFTGLAALPFDVSSIDIYDNNFTFEGILPYKSNISLFFPQRKIGVSKTTTLNEGESFIIELGIDQEISTNIYTWYKDRVLYKTTSENRLIINNVTTSDAGIYTCEVSNTEVPLSPGYTRTLQSNPETLIVRGFSFISHPENTTICADNSASFSVTANRTNVNYQWEVSTNNGSTWTGISGANSASYAKIVSTTENGYMYRCVVSDGTTSLTSNAATLTVKTKPGSVGAITGTNQLCEDWSVRLSVTPLPGATSYEWKVPQEAQIIVNDGTSIDLKFTIQQSLLDTVYVNAKNECGAGPISKVWVYVAKKPTSIGAITGHTSVYKTATGLIYSIEPVEHSAGEYDWSLPAGFELVDGFQTTSIKVNISSTAASGVIKIYVSRCGAELVSELPVTVYSSPLVTDSLALVDLYNSTNGPAWSRKNNWLTGRINNWYGVRITNNRVIGLELASNNLVGNLPYSLGMLSNLQSLRLENNQLTGEIPVSYWNLTNILQFRVSNNQLSGVIPFGVGNLTKIQGLFLDRNQFTGAIPSEIGNLNKATIIYLNNNQFTGNIPSTVNKLASVIDFNLGNNQLSGTIPSSFGSLTRVQWLYLNNNQLSGSLPVSFGNASFLYLNNNQLSGSIPSSFNTSRLVSLFLNENKLIGEIPASFSSSTTLRDLGLNNNFFNKLPLLPGSMPQSGLVQSNYFTFDDIIPNINHLSTYSPQNTIGSPRSKAIYSGTTDTIQLNFDNGITTSTYTWYKDGTQVAQTNTNALTISNATSGNAGTYTCNITNASAAGLTLTIAPVTLVVKDGVVDQDSLALVDLYNSTNGPGWTKRTNWLTGPVKSWSGITVSGGRVISISLYNNNLVGTIPSSIGNLTKLTTLQLGSNKLSGTIPESIGNLTNLTTLNLYSNQLSGAIPSSIGNLTNLASLMLTSNQLTGEIPNSLANLTKLQHLYLNLNQFSGTIPPWVCNLTNLTELSFHTNKLIGAIPNDIGNLTKLVALELHTNQLTGAIPSSIGNLTNLTKLRLCATQLSGEIPSSIGNLVNLTELYLYSNQLTGSIPPSIGNLTNLKILQLNANKLSGELPSSIIAKLSQLTALNLNWNQLSGAIPANLGSLSNLAYLYLTNNKFTSLPILNASLPKIAEVKSNNFSFDDILPNISHIASYSPQGKVGTAKTTILNVGGTHTVKLGIDSSLTTNVYKWYRNGSLFTTTNVNTLVINNLTTDKAGIYTCEVTNPAVSGLTLYSNPDTLVVTNIQFALQPVDVTVCQEKVATYTVSLGIGNAYYKWSRSTDNGTTWTDVAGAMDSVYTINATSVENGYLYRCLATLGTIEVNSNTARLTVNPLPSAAQPIIGTTTVCAGTSGSYHVPAILNANSYEWTAPSWAQITKNNGDTIELTFAADTKSSGSISVKGVNACGSGQPSVLPIALFKTPETAGPILGPNASYKNAWTVSYSVPALDDAGSYEWTLPNGALFESGGGNAIKIRYTNTAVNSNISVYVKSKYGCGNSPSATLPITIYPTITYRDSMALVELYNSTNGPGWTNKTNWLIGRLSTWYGVTVSGDKVNSINLSNNNLTGTIPSTIGNMSGLYNLNLNTNKLSGTIPYSIGALGNLATLYLYSNQLSGSIPPELGNLAKLTNLSLYTNQLSGTIPSSLGKLGNLNTLSLHTNQLSGELPSSIGTLPKLSSLLLYNNKLTGSIPSSFGNLGALTSLYLNTNQLSGSIPASIGNLSNLTSLVLNTNNLSGNIPSSIGNLTKLTRLALYGNQLNGAIPSSLGNLVNLTILQLNNNLLGGELPPSLGNLSKLQTFYLYNNKFNKLYALNSALTKITRVQENRLSFDDIIPNISFISHFSPQNKVGVAKTTRLNVCNTYAIKLGIDSALTTNVYRWYKNGSLYATTSINTLVINNVKTTDAGVYTCTITNPGLTGLTLTSFPDTLVVTGMQITVQPTPMTVCEGSSASLSINTSIPGAYQWQASIDKGKTWTDLTGAQGKTYALDTTALIDARVYRCAVSAGCLPVIYSDTARLTVNPLPVINSQPENQTLCEESAVSLSINATSPDNTPLNYQWQEYVPNEWQNISGQTGSSFEITAARSLDKKYYRCQVTNLCQVNSNPIQFFIKTKPQITTQPIDADVCQGATASFRVLANGSDSTFQWHVSADGGANWSLLEGATANIYTLPATASLNGYQYRCEVGGLCAPSVTSSAATLLIKSTPVLSGQPTNQSVEEGTSAGFSVVASGDNLTYQWQRNSTGTWADINDATANIFAVPATSDNIGNYRCIVSNTCISNIARLSIAPKPQIESHPKNQIACNGANVLFAVDVKGFELEYQWQYSADGVNSWTNVENATSENLEINATPSTVGYYKCIVAEAGGLSLETNAAQLTLRPSLQISAHPTNLTTCEGAPATFGCSLNVNEGLKYMWFESTDNGISWNPINGANALEYARTAALDDNNKQYRCNITDGCDIQLTTNAAALEVIPSTRIVTQPAAQALCEGSIAQFNVSATGAGLTYQWQQLGTTGWTSIAAQTPTYSVEVSADIHNKYYRCAVTGTCGTVTSQQALLSMGPQITNQLMNQMACDGSSVTLGDVAVLSATPVNYEWEQKADEETTWTKISGANKLRYTFNASMARNNTLYRAVAKGNCGMEARSNEARLAVVTTTITTSPADISECHGNSVAFSVQATGYELEYQWELSPDAGVTWNEISGAKAATLNIGVQYSMNNYLYRCKVKCSCETSWTVSGSAKLTAYKNTITPLAATIKTVTCEVGTNDGAITIATPTSDNMPLSYKWSNNATSLELTSLNAGTYTLTVTDALGCRAILTNNVEYEAPIKVETAIEDIAVPGTATGKIDNTILGGHTPLRFKWSNNDTTKNLSDLKAGTYNLTITDSKQCVRQYGFVVKEQPAIAYLTGEDIPDAEHRELDKNLSVGSIAGSAGVSPTGAATYQIPIEVLPGVNNMQPQISVGYNSQSGNGLLGWGWNIGGLSAITRVPKTIYHDEYAQGLNLDANDAFALDGSRLMLIKAYGTDSSEYATENESFSKIKSYGSFGGNGPDRFEVLAKNGARYVYGKADAKLIYEYVYLKDGRHALYDTIQAVLTWCLDTIVDKHGNYITYTYNQKGLNTYITKIDYGCNINTDCKVTNTIEFEYAERQDPISIHYGVKTSRMDMLLKSVSVKRANSTYRKYGFNYIKDDFSRLVKVTESTIDGKSINPTLFKWGKHSSDSISSKSIKVSQHPNVDPYGQYFISFDANNDGFTDLFGIYSDGLGGTGGRFNCNTTYYGSPVSFYVGHYYFLTMGDYIRGAKNDASWVQHSGNSNYGDINGDGGIDIITPKWTHDAGSRVKFEIEFAAEFNSKTIEHRRTWDDPLVCVLTASSEAPVYTLGDINNDGYDEIVCIEKNSNEIINGSGDGRVRMKRFPGKIYYPKEKIWRDFNKFISPKKPERIAIVDVNNDGLKDVIVLNSMDWVIMENLGGNVLDFKVHGTNVDLDSEMISQMGDFSGDGLVDIIVNPRNGSTDWKLYINNGNFGFNEISNLGITAFDDKDTNKDDDKDNTIVFDFNNDGKKDIIVADAHYNWESNMWSSWKVFSYYTMYWYKSTGNGFVLVKTATSRNEKDAYSKFFAPGDFDGDGRVDLVNYGFNPYSGKSKKSQTWWMVNLPNKNNESDVIIGIADGLNKKTIINYKPLTDTSIYKTNRKYVYPFGVVVPPLYVVNEIKTNNGLGGYNIVNNKYENAVLHKQGKGFLGFDKLEQFNTTTGFSSITENTFNTSYFNLAKQLTATLHGTDTVSRAISYYTVRGNPANSKVIFTYPAFTQNVDKLKGITVNSSSEYDTNGNLTNQNSSVNEGFYKTKKEWTDFDGFGNPKTTTTTLERAGETPITRTQSYTYNNNGSVISSLVNGLTTTYGYDAWGNDTSVISAPGENQRKSSTLYSADGRFPAIQKNALGHLGKATFDDWGNPLTQTDANGNVTQNIYDSWGNLKEVKTPDKHVGQNIVEWVKEGDNQAPQYALYYTEKKVDDLFVSAEYFDTLGRSLRKVSTGYKGAKFWTDIKYNNLGQVTEVSNPYPEGGSPSKFTISTYDYLGRVETQKSPEEVTIQNAYSGNTITTTYSTGQTYEKTSDATGQLILAKDPGGAIQYSYNSENKPRQVQSPGSTIQIKYDKYGRQDTLIDPNTGTIAYHYNLFGELVSQTDARGKTITSTFDKLGRIETKTADGATTQYYYDKGEKALGTTDSIVRSDGTAVSFKYTTDGLCRVKEETRRKDGVSFTYSYDYNDKGLLSRLTYPGGFAVNYGYTEDDDLEEIRDARTEALLWKLGKINPKNGQVEETSYGDKLKVTYGYNANDQLNRILVPGVIDFNYQYNEKQQLQWREELYFEKDAWAGFKEEFAYDPVNRLDSVSIGGAVKLRMKYADSNNTANDRITYKSDAGDYAYQSGNHRISVLTTVAGYTPPSHYLSYTAEGKVDTIREVTDTATVKRFLFSYGIDNQRFSMKYTVNDTLRYTRYYADNFEKEIMADGTERNLTYIYANGSLVAINIQTAGTDSTFFVFTDQLGSLRCITDVEGKVRQRLSFDAWGNRRNPITGEKDTTILPSNGGVGGGLLLARGFTGHEHLDEMSLINMNGRVYDPVLGMFISPDNNLQAPDNTQNFNRYAYCLNNPLMYTDPSGEFIFTLLAAIFCPPLLPVAMNLDYAWTVGGYSSMENGGGFWSGAGNGLLTGAITAGMSFGSGLASNALGITSTVGVAATSGISSFVGAGLSSLVTSGEWNWEQAITAGATSALISGLNQYEINHTITGEISMDNSGAGDGARPSTPTGVGSSDRLLLSKMPNAKKMMKKYNIKDVTVESKKSYNGGKVKILRDENGDLVVVDKRTGKTIITHPDGITVPLANGYDIYIGRSPANNGLIFDGVWKHEFNHAYMLTERIGDKIGEAKYMWRERVCYRLTLSQVKDPQWNELYFKSMLENGNAGGWNSFIDKHWKSYISPYFR